MLPELRICPLRTGAASRQDWTVGLLMGHLCTGAATEAELDSWAAVEVGLY